MRILLALLLLCATATFTFAQPGVAVSGIVQDQTGGLLPAATADHVNASARRGPRGNCSSRHA